MLGGLADWERYWGKSKKNGICGSRKGGSWERAGKFERLLLLSLPRDLDWRP